MDSQEKVANMSQQPDYSECVKAQKAEFNSYDQTVDVVSCWHSYFDSVFVRNGVGAYFDRFPETPVTKLRPDFTMLFGEDYGIVGEVARSVSENARVLDSKAMQLKSYDSGIEFRANNKGDFVKPRIQDTLLILNSMHSDRGAQMLLDLHKRTKNLAPDNNLVLMEYNFAQVDAQSIYFFKKIVFDRKHSFRDQSLPGEFSLERMLGKERQPLKCSPEKFCGNKATHLFCNDSPCPIYLATRLWDRILITQATEDAQRKWKRKSTAATAIPTTTNAVCDLINNKIVPGCKITSETVKNALKYLEIAGRATSINDAWVISYGNLKRRKAKTIGNSRQENAFFEMKEIGDILAEMYCKGLRGDRIQLDEEPEEGELSRQSFLGDY